MTGIDMASVATIIAPWPDRTSGDGLSEIWREADRRRWLGDVDGTHVLWVARRRNTDLPQTVRLSLQRYIEQRPGGCVLLDDTLDEMATRFLSGLQVMSPIFSSGVSLPATWLKATRLVVICELAKEPSGLLHGAMAAQAEPLEVVSPQPWFRRPQLVCEAHRLGRAALVVVMIPTSEGTYCLVSPSALLADVLIAKAVGLGLAEVPHLAEWQRHYSIPEAYLTAEWLVSIPKPEGWNWAERFSSKALNIAGKGLGVIDEARDDFGKARENLYRIPSFVRKRMGRQE